jgi:hypothetical protein
MVGVRGVQRQPTAIYLRSRGLSRHSYIANSHAGSSMHAAKEEWPRWRQGAADERDEAMFLRQLLRTILF